MKNNINRVSFIAGAFECYFFYSWEQERKKNAAQATNFEAFASVF